jgi:hypothetical protein
LTVTADPQHFCICLLIANIAFLILIFLNMRMIARTEDSENISHNLRQHFRVTYPDSFIYHSHGICEQLQYLSRILTSACACHLQLLLTELIELNILLLESWIFRTEVL